MVGSCAILRMIHAPRSAEFGFNCHVFRGQTLFLRTQWTALIPEYRYVKHSTRIRVLEYRDVPRYGWPGNRIDTTTTFRGHD